MPSYRVVLAPEARRNIADISAWITGRSPQGAIRWYQALRLAIARLRDDPMSFAVAPESPRFDVEIRDIFFKTRRGLPYRMLFTISGNEISVLYVRGPGQDWVMPRSNQ